jgi:hypothetical protein
MATTSFNPFLTYSLQLQALFTKASKQKDPASWLYKNDVRTVLFMLEALTRLHNHAFEEKVFDKWNKRFKKLEDLFGEIDEYASLETDFKSNTKIPKEVIKYFTLHKENFLEKCNRRLRSKDWLSDKVSAFDAKINEFDHSYGESYMDELRFSLEKEVDEILYFTLKVNYNFTRIEEEVHEIRRKLRWLSIYVQALQGMIQLKKSAKRKKQQLHYFTKEVLNSPYNKVSPKPKDTAIIEFDSDSFFAVSWLITELGKMKDCVLNIYQLRDALYVTDEINKTDATKKAIDILGLKPSVEKDVLKEASIMIKTALTKDKILDGLIVK